MSSPPKKCVVDTNVPKIANLALKPDPDSDVPDSCIEECIFAVERVRSRGGLVLDESGEIFREYLDNLSLGGQSGVGDAFAKWVNDNQWNSQHVDRISISKTGENYDQFPYHVDLQDFDKADRKFVAVANAHPDKPPILQGTDSKWCGWKDALEDVGITVNFLCPDYVKEKYSKKMPA